MNTSFTPHEKLKKTIYLHVISLLDDKIESAQKAVLNAKESRDNETKSSAGDKHETGRSMSQLELDNCEIQLGKVMNLKRHFLQFNYAISSNTVIPGSLVKCDNGMYLFSVGLGKIRVNEQECFVISMQSPFGQALQNKAIEDVVVFNKRHYTVKEIT